MTDRDCGINLRMDRISLAFFTFLATIAFADFAGWGHNYFGLVCIGLYFLFLRSLGERKWRVYLGVMLAFSVVVAAMAVEQWWFMPRPRGPFRSANFLGAYAVLMLALAYTLYHEADILGQRWVKHLLVVVSLANLVSFALARSRGAMVALGLVWAILGWRRYPYTVAWMVMLLTMAIGYLTLDNPYGFADPRLDLWRIGISAALQRPLLGWGENGLMVAGVGVFYNVALEWAINAGIIGLIAGAWLYIEAVRVAGRGPLLAFLAAYLAQGMFLFSGPATTIPLVTVLAWLASEQRRVERRTRAIDYEQPFLDGRVRADRPYRGHGGRDGAICSKGGGAGYLQFARLPGQRAERQVVAELAIERIDKLVEVGLDGRKLNGVGAGDPGVEG
jgi:hypothetical protein